MWAYESVFYQIYPLGFSGSAYENDGNVTNGIKKMQEWIPHIKKTGANAIYFSPVFESDSHGYNTRDYRLIDRRLGTNEEFTKLCENLHQEEIKVVLDGVFNHVGRGFWAFQDVLKNRESSEFKDWFFLDFHGNSGYQDGLWYEGWEGHYDLVKLNLHNPEVVKHLLDSVGNWIDWFDIDGIRLDVAYCLDISFMKQLRQFVDNKKEEFFLLGEMVHGDYNKLLNEAGLDSVTNYEGYKGLYSSFNDLNLFEINHTLQRQFGNQGCLYGGKHLFSFADNHDVSRIASILKQQEHLKLVYSLLFTMPGIPCLYYGSEWGIKGDKKEGDWKLRPSLEMPEYNELTEYIEKLAQIHKNSNALQYGEFKTVLLTNRQCIIERKTNQERILIGINADNSEYRAHVNLECQEVTDLIEEKKIEIGNEINMPPLCAFIWKV